MKLARLFPLVFLFLQCEKRVTSEDLLQLIKSYENFEAYDKESFLWGIFQKSAFKRS